MSSPLWKVIHAFGSAAVGEPPQSDLQTGVIPERIRAIADRSKVTYFTDGKRLWSAPAPPATQISAREALDRFGVDRLYEAREYGSS
jgi:hypothetical protein